MSCGCGSCSLVPENVLAGRWDAWARCASLASAGARKLCRLSHVLTENHDMTTKPDVDETDLAEKIRKGVETYPATQRATVEKKLKAAYAAIRGTGLSHKAAINASMGILDGDRKMTEDEGADEGAGPLPDAIAEAAAPLAGAQRLEVERAFRSKYAELRKKMAAARARLEAATYAQTEAERLIGLIGPHRDDTVLDPYLVANQRLTEDIEGRVRSGQSFALALASAQAAYPNLVAAVTGPRRNEAD